MNIPTVLARSVVLTTFAMAIAAQAAYLESNPGDAVTHPEPAPRILPAPLPGRDNPLVALATRLEIGEAYSYRGLTVYPLVLRTHGSGPDIMTLDEALAHHDLNIREKEVGQVSFVQVGNEGRRPVLLMAGEILIGGRQNRVVRDDVLLPSRSAFIDVAVYCGEQDRWQAADTTFKSGNTMTAPGIREMAAVAASQDSIWREIDGKLRQAEVKSETRSYQAYFEDKEIKNRLEECVRQFRACRTSRTAGLIVVGGDRILGGDIFADPGLCSRLWDKIVRSYGSDIVIQPLFRERDDGAKRGGPSPAIGREEVQRLLDRIRTASLDLRDTPGLGRLYRIRGGLNGNALILSGEVVHAAVFTKGRDLPHPVRPQLMPLGVVE